MRAQRHLPPRPPLTIATPPTTPTHSLLLQVVDGPVIGPNQTLIATSDGGYVCAIGCNASGAAPLPLSASPSVPALPTPTSAPAGGSLSSLLILSSVGASVALAAAGLGLAVWFRSSGGDSSSDGRSIIGGSSISGGYGGGYGATSQRVNSRLPRHMGTYSVLEEISPIFEMNPILVPDVALGEPSEDPMVEPEERGAGGADMGVDRGEGAIKLIIGLRQHRYRGPPEAMKPLP